MSFSILVEGLDLAGKSTLIAGLSQRLQGCSLATRTSSKVLCPDNPVGPLAERVATEGSRQPYELSCLYLASHLWDMRHYRADERIHLQDSCWLRSKAYDRRQGLLLPWDQAGGMEFDVVLYLTAALPVRQWRYRLRQRKLGQPYQQDHWLFTRPDPFLALDHHLQQELAGHPHLLVLDTSASSVDNTLALAWDFVSRALPVPVRRGA